MRFYYSNSLFTFIPLSLLALAGCAYNPYNPELEQSNTASSLIATNNFERDNNDEPGKTVEQPAMEKYPLVEVDEDYETPPPIVFPASADPNLKLDGDLYINAKKGDNLKKLAKKYTGDAENWKELARINDLDNREVLAGAKKLRIPNILKVLDVTTVEKVDDSLPIAKTIPVKK